MPSSVDFNGRPFHFIGIGGIGMSALAYILAKRKLPVYGSDLKSSHITERLQEMGAHIFWQQDGSNFSDFQMASPSPDAQILQNCSANLQKDSSGVLLKNLKEENTRSHKSPQVVCSTAINTNNLEYKAAVDLGYPIFHRSDILAALIDQYQSIAVAGTHGKTTTSSLIGFLLYKAGLDPTIIVGGEVNAWEGNARLGASPYLVAEADESDGSLIKFSPQIGVITNIELDHPDHYQSLADVISTFKIFTQQCGQLVACIDCPTLEKNFTPTITYSLFPERQADYTVDQVEYGSDYTQARIWERGQILGTVQLKLLGSHNLGNSLAAIAVGRLLGLEFPVIAQALKQFEGTRRRFEVRGYHQGILFVDDYAHHPSEIRVTLAAARLRVEGKEIRDPTSSGLQRVVAIFQPHRYSRTQTFLQEFAHSFSDADLVVLTDIYSAGEANPGQMSGQTLADLMSLNHPEVYYQPTSEGVHQLLREILKPGDLVLFLGAGNLNQIIPQLMGEFL